MSPRKYPPFLVALAAFAATQAVKTADQNGVHGPRALLDELCGSRKAAACCCTYPSGAGATQIPNLSFAEPSHTARPAPSPIS